MRSMASVLIALALPLTIHGFVGSQLPGLRPALSMGISSHFYVNRGPRLSALAGLSMQSRGGRGGGRGGRGGGGVGGPGKKAGRMGKMVMQEIMSILRFVSRPPLPCPGSRAREERGEALAAQIQLLTS